MKSVTRKILALLMTLALLTLAACSDEAAPGNSATPSSSKAPSSQSESTTPPSSSTPSSESQPPLAVSSYDEYFSQSVDFVNNVDDTAVGNVFIYQEGVPDPKEWIDAELLKAFPDAADGQLYKWETNTTDPSNHIVEYSLLLDDAVTEFVWAEENRIICAAGNTVYSINYSGEDKQTMFTADGPVTNLAANETLVFYVVNEYLYRYYIPDKITDKLCHAPGISPGYPVPLTNHQVLWSVAAPDRPEVDYTLWYVYTGPDSEAEEISLEEMESLFNEWAERVGL